MKNDGEQLRDDTRQEELQPDPVFEGRVSPLWAGISLLVVVCLAAAVLYAVLRDPNVPHVSRAPAPGSVPLPDNPVSTTKECRSRAFAPAALQLGRI